MTFAALQGRRLHLGVCGSVAAYKAVELMRMLQRGGLSVSVTLTEAATRFITPLTFESLGAEGVYTHMFGQDDGTHFAHLTPGAVCDAFVVAPATATTLARLVHGMADDMLAAQALAFSGPLVLAPAMNPRMWHNAATRENLERLVKRGAEVIAPGCGAVACGDEGQGKLADIGDIYNAALRAVCRALPTSSLCGQKIMITMGPTREAWDGVRCWTNLSTGYMGACLAHAAWVRGAEVYAVAGPGVPALPASVRRMEVTSAREMYEAATRLWPEMTAGIFTAAVADFSPVPLGPQKFKKVDAADGLNIAFTPNADILADLAASKKPQQRIMGFAAETDDVENQTRAKLTRKKADIIVGNRIGVEGSGFASATNEVFVADVSGREESWPVQPKPDVAWRLLNWLFSR